MKKEQSTIQVMERAHPHPRIIPQISKMVKRVVNHKTLKEIIRIAEEEAS